MAILNMLIKFENIALCSYSSVPMIFFRVRIILTIDPINATGAILANNHLILCRIVPATAKSGLL